MPEGFVLTEQQMPVVLTALAVYVNRVHEQLDKRLIGDADKATQNINIAKHLHSALFDIMMLAVSQESTNPVAEVVERDRQAAASWKRIANAVNRHMDTAQSHGGDIIAAGIVAGLQWYHHEFVTKAPGSEPL